jgi:hypothetical protein
MTKEKTPIGQSNEVEGTPEATIAAEVQAAASHTIIDALATDGDATATAELAAIPELPPRTMKFVFQGETAILFINNKIVTTFSYSELRALRAVLLAFPNGSMVGRYDQFSTWHVNERLQQFLTAFLDEQNTYQELGELFLILDIQLRAAGVTEIGLSANKEGMVYVDNPNFDGIEIRIASAQGIKGKVLTIEGFETVISPQQAQYMEALLGFLQTKPGEWISGEEVLQAVGNEVGRYPLSALLKTLRDVQSSIAWQDRLLEATGIDIYTVLQIDVRNTAVRNKKLSYFRINPQVRLIDTE